LHPISYNAVRRWIKKIEEPIATERKQRNLIAIDETVANKKSYFVYSAVDIERNELILMKVYTTGNYLTTFVK
jgi:putative transposase